ncbi:polymorphic toxin type 17 domain-containing protein [Frischella perrara]|uniref:polymorphic toxin type 17 domain-containing protein n=1 Tax=Frischella perrara TaxID=1267021 RepID=UPI003C6DAE0B
MLVATIQNLSIISLQHLFLIRFVLSKSYFPNKSLLRGNNNGYIDRFLYECIKCPSRIAGQEFEWNVQLSELGKKQLGWASRDGKYLNVSLDGKITHK